MGKSTIKDILTNVVNNNWPFTKLVVLQKEDDERVIAFYDQNLHDNPSDQGWFELVFSNWNTGLLGDKRVLGALLLVPDASQYIVAEQFGFTTKNSNIHILNNMADVQRYLKSTKGESNVNNNVVSILQHITTLDRSMHERVYVIGDEVFCYDEVNSGISPWIKIEKVDDSFTETYVYELDGEHNVVDIGDDVQHLMQYLKTPIGTEYRELNGIIAIGQFIDQLIAANDEISERHDAYFTMLDELSEKHQLALQEMRVFLRQVASGTASLTRENGFDSKEYSLHQANLDKTFRAVENAMTNIAEVHFKEKK